MDETGEAGSAVRSETGQRREQGGRDGEERERGEHEEDQREQQLHRQDARPGLGPAAGAPSSELARSTSTIGTSTGVVVASSVSASGNAPPSSVATSTDRNRSA